MTARVCGLLMLACAIAAAQVQPTVTLHDKGAHFDHKDHAAQRGVTLEPCAQCHAIATDGLPEAPAALGHSPCLSAGCHASYFLAIGATKPSDPTLVDRATAFCLGCHDTPDGRAPKPTSKPPWNTALRSFEAEREWHVEMPHFDHVVKDRERTDCKSCHLTGDATAATPWALVPGTPGHQQCGVCHNASDPVLRMDRCEGCHKAGARASYLGDSREAIDVRACDSEGYLDRVAKLAAKGKTTPVPCFKHERQDHRVTIASGKPVEVECVSCHYMINDKARWAGRRYETLVDLHRNPIIDNRQNEEHKSCSTGNACHAVDLAANKCELCHAGRNAF